MSLTDREWWAIIHGMILGAIFLLAFAGGIAEFWSLREGELTEAGIAKRTRRLEIGTWVMAAAAWLTVATGSYIVYPWYREEPDGPRFDLLADPELQSNANDVALHFSAQLAQFGAVQGRGLMIGVELEPEIDAKQIVSELLLDHRIIANATGPSTLRFLPPLIATNEDADRVLEALTQVFPR